MTPESPLRAQADNRLSDTDSVGIQAGLFDTDNFDDAHENSSLLSDYRQRYGLSEDPFSDDYSFPLFTAAGRRQALDQLLHLCQFSNQLLVITGEAGVGKTRIAHALADSLEENDHLCFLALSLGQTLEQLLRAIAESFNLEINEAASIDELIKEIEKFVELHALNQEAESDGLVLLIIDNAEHLDAQCVAVLGSLLENKPQPYPLHIVLVGEPVLVSRVSGIESENLQISDFHLPAFTLSETVDYLNFRMEMADYLGPEIFTEAIVDPWWRQAHGQLSLIHESAQDKLLQSVLPQSESRRFNFPLFHIMAISAVIAVAGVFYLYLDKPEKNTEVLVAIPNVTAKSSVAVTESSQPIVNTQTPLEPILQSLPEVSINQSPAENIPDTSETVADSAASSAISNQPAVDVQIDEIKEPVVAANETTANETAALANNSIENNPTSTAADITRLTEPKPRISNPSAGEFSADEQEILSWSSSRYTIQILGVSNLKSAQDFVNSQTNKSDLLIFETRRAGKKWYVVVSGHFASNAEARSAVSRLPAKQRETGPWPRQINVIQQEIRQ
jgi:DamX protein